MPCRYSSGVPTLLREGGYRFKFWSDEGSEPPHVHVRGHGGSAKVWLVPGIELEGARNYNQAQIGRILRITERHRDEFIAAWQRHFGR